jgi:hypothetical protein
MAGIDPTAALIDDNTGSLYSSNGLYNVLHDYSSYNYVFTLAVLTKEQSNSTTFFNSSPNLDFIILKTSGKGSKGINLSNVVSYGSTDPLDRSEELDKDQELQALLTEFNAKGSGRFDFYVDSLDFDGPLALNEGATNVVFNMSIIEPMSMNSFLESVRVNCLAAGHESHVGAPMCLKIEFWGWNGQTGKAEQVPKATRYYSVNLQSDDITQDERGTVHRVTFASLNTMGYGIDGETPTTIKMVGETVGEMLTHFLDTVTEESKKQDGSKNPTVYNTYHIEFIDNVFTDQAGNIAPNKAYTSGGVNYTGEEVIIKNKKINPDKLRSNQSFEFSSPTANTPKNNYKHTKKQNTSPAKPNNETITVKSGSKIYQIIESVVRDSEYTRWMIDNKEKFKENGGYVPWYRVTVRTEIRDYNRKQGRPSYAFYFQVRPYWVHFSKLPEEFGEWDTTEIRNTLVRQYNYVYTGKNVDLLEFQYKLDGLYLQDRPYKLGNQDRSGTSLAAAPNNTNQNEAAEQNKKTTDSAQNNAPAKAGTVADVPMYGTTKNVQLTPYESLAAAIQNQIIKNNSMQWSVVKIIGDPYYMVTAGVGNSNVEEFKQNSGEAPWLDQEIYISIDFKNPTDYREDGFVDFGQNKIDHFSGVYSVKSVATSFRDGQFIQTLNLNRLPGQQWKKPVVKAIPFVTTPKQGEQATKNSAPASVNNYGVKKVQTDLTKLLNPKIPSLGLEGLFSGISGLANSASNALQSSVKRLDAAVQEGLGVISGIVVPLEKLALGAAQIGGIVAVADALLHPQNNDNQVGQSISGYDPYTNGIPIETNTVPAPSDTAQNQANKAAQSNIISSFVQDNTNLAQIETNYANNVITADGRNYITNPSDQTNLNNIGQKTLAAINGTPTDPSAIAAQLGIDPAQFSGLSADQQSSLLAQLQNVFSKVPIDANIQGYQALGLSLKNLTGAGIANLPALQALTTAPLANVSQYDLQKIIASGGNVANLPGASAFASIGALIALLSSKPSDGSSGGNPLDQNTQIDKFNTAQALNEAGLNTPGLDPALVGLGSIESNYANAVRTVQGYSGYYVELKTVNNLYGTQRELSPLDKLMLTKQI